MGEKIGIIGPGRVKNGIGEYTAKYFSQLDADVIAVAASSYSHAKNYASILNRNYGIDPIPYNSVKDMLISGNLDAVAICSPPQVHFEQLQNALSAGVHVFCEKPLIWEDGNDNAKLTHIIIKQFQQKNLILHYNTQWIYTLPAYEKICGRIDPLAINSFSVELSPSNSDSWFMIKESAPHANSLLLAIGAIGPFRSLVISESHKNNPEQKKIEISFTVFNATGKNIQGSYIFKVTRKQPRPAAYSINGNRVERTLSRHDYAMAFNSKKNQIPMEDPLKDSVKHFLSKIRKFHSEKDGVLSDALILKNMEMLSQLHNKVNQ